MKRTVAARLYALTTQGTTYELTASSAADLAAQVQQLTGSRQAAQLARLSWADDDADVNAAGVHLVATGRLVREVWRTLPAARRAAQPPAEQEATQAAQDVQDDETPDAQGSAEESEQQAAHPWSAVRRPPEREA